MNPYKSALGALFAGLTLYVPGEALAQNRLQIFTFPHPIRYSHHNDDYTVRARVPGGQWQDVYEYRAKVDHDLPQKDASMVHFNFEGTIEVAVQKNNGTFSKVAIRPTSRGIRHTVRNNTVYFTLDAPQNLSIEFDEDRMHNLHLFTNAIRRDLPVTPVVVASPYDITEQPLPDLTRPVVYFGPGLYKGEIRLRSDSTVYIDGSAVIQGPLIFDKVENVKVISDGVFDNAGQTHIRDSRNIVIDGTIHINQKHGTLACFASSQIQELNIRTIGGGQWSDGLGHFACEDVKISGGFLRTSDDNITLYNHRWDTWGDTRNILVENVTLWADVAHNVMIGIHGNTPSEAHPKAEVIENVVFRNIDVLDHDEDEPDYQGVIGLMVGDDNLVRNITFEDWRVERIEEGKLFSLQVLYNAKYNTSPGRGIEDITLRNIHFTGTGAWSPSLIRGYDAERKVRNVRIENVTVGGRKLTGAEADLLDTGPYTEGITFR